MTFPLSSRSNEAELLISPHLLYDDFGILDFLVLAAIGKDRQNSSAVGVDQSDGPAFRLCSGFTPKISAPRALISVTRPRLSTEMSPSDMFSNRMLE
jgi:hypothetical protein